MTEKHTRVMNQSAKTLVLKSDPQTQHLKFTSR